MKKLMDMIVFCASWKWITYKITSYSYSFYEWLVEPYVFMN